MTVAGGDAGDRDRVMAWGFVLVQLVLLAAVFLLPGGDAWTPPSWLSDVAHGLSLAGLAAVAAGLVNLGRSATPLPVPVENGELRSSGLYRFVRHPIYSGVMTLVVGSAIGSGSIAIASVAATLVAWLIVKARWEERRLAARYPGYAAYAARTPRFIPFRLTRSKD